MDDGINMGLLIAMIEQASGADPEQIEQFVQNWLDAHPEATTTVQDGSITLAKLASDLAAKINQVSQLSDEIDKLTPIAMHFYYPGKEPSIDTQNRTITFYANCPFFVYGKAYNKTSDTVINIPDSFEQNTDYAILYLDLNNSSWSTLSFKLLPYVTAVSSNYAYVGQMNIRQMIFSFPFNVSIDGTLYYALGDDVEPIKKILTVNCDYETFSGGYIRADNGNVSGNQATGYTGFIDVSGFSHIVNPVDYPQTYQMAFYNENKEYVSGATTTPREPIVWTIPVPENAKYARLSFYLSVQDQFYAHGIIADLNKYIKSHFDRTQKLQGKKLGIIGDSISTFQGYIPSGYTTFYPRNTVTNVNLTWWKQLLDETGMELCVNASWSGSTITGDTTDTSGVVGCSDARVNTLTDGNGNKPDIIIVWMGINDFGKTNGRTCGTYDGTTSVITDTSITSITDAFGVLLKKLETAYPDARIFVCRILPEQFASEMADSYANGFPNINPNDNISLPELNERIEKIANAFGCGIIPMDKCGATFFNINTYTGDGLHPNALLTPKLCKIAKEALLGIV